MTFDESHIIETAELVDAGGGVSIAPGCACRPLDVEYGPQTIWDAARAFVAPPLSFRPVEITLFGVGGEGWPETPQERARRARGEAIARALSASR